MATRLPASQRTREELSALIEGRLSTASAKDELVKLATRLIVEEALEGEAGDAVGRDYYEHGAQPGQGYRNGYRTGRLKTAEGLMEYSAPQVAGRDEPFRSAIREHLKGHTQGLEDLAVEMLARGLSVRDIEDAFKDESGRLLLSKTAVSQLGERLWEDYQAFAKRETWRIRDHLSVRRWHCRAVAAWRQARAGAGGVGLYDRGPPGAAAFDGGLEGGCRDGDRVLRGHEDARAHRPAAGDLGRRARHHQGDRGVLSARRPPALPGPSHAQSGGQGAGGRVAGVQGAGAGGLSGAEPGDRARACGRRRCRLRPQAGTRSRVLHGRLRSLHRPLRFPVTHRRAIRTTNLLERLFVEERRRLKIIPNAFGERAVLKLMFGALIRAAERWRSVKVTEFERRQMAAVRKELDQEYEAMVGLKRSPQRMRPKSEYPAVLGLDPPSEGNDAVVQFRQTRARYTANAQARVRGCKHVPLRHFKRPAVHIAPGRRGGVAARGASDDLRTSRGRWARTSDNQRLIFPRAPREDRSVRPTASSLSRSDATWNLTVWAETPSRRAITYPGRSTGSAFLT